MAAVTLNSVNKDNFGFADPRSYGNCLCWLDAADPKSMTLSGTDITLWNDKTGNGYNVSPTVGTVTYTTVGAYRVASFPAEGAYMTSAASIPTITAGATNIYIVARPIAMYGTSGLNYFFQYDSASDYSIRYGSDYKLLGVGSATTSDIGYTSGGTASSYIVNEVSISTTNPALNTSFNIVYTPLNTSRSNSNFLLSSNIGTGTNARFFIGYMCEILIYATLPTVAQRRLIETYLAYKWGIPSLLPSGITLYKQVPRAVQFNPLMFNTCNLWLDAYDSSSYTLSGGTTLTQWIDKSGVANNSSSIVGTPTYSATGLNGLPAFSLTGSSAVIGPNVNSGTSVSVFIVATMNASTGAAGRLLSLGGAGVADTLTALRTGAITRNGTTPASINTRRNGTLSSRDLAGFDTPAIMSTIFDGTNNILYINGTAGNTSASTGSFGYTLYGIGRDPGTGTAYWYGFVSEVLIYNRALTTTERQFIEGYLAQKWGLRTSLPATHSFYNAANVPNTPLFSPDQLSTALTAWYDGRDPNNDIATIPANSASVTTWKDKSANGNNTSGGVAPTYSLSLKAVSFNGSTQYYATTGISASLQNETIIGVFKLSSTAPKALLGTNTGSGGRAIGLDGSSRLSVLKVNVNYYSIVTTPLTTTNPYIFTYTASASSTNVVTNLSVNGGTRFSSTFATFTGGLTTQLGADRAAATFSGTMYEIMFFPSALALNDYQRIEGYLAWKWGLNNFLPTTHPYYKIKP